MLYLGFWQFARNSDFFCICQKVPFFCGFTIIFIVAPYFNIRYGIKMTFVNVNIYRRMLLNFLIKNENAYNLHPLCRNENLLMLYWVCMKFNGNILLRSDTHFLQTGQPIHLSLLMILVGVGFLKTLYVIEKWII